MDWESVIVGVAARLISAVVIVAAYYCGRYFSEFHTAKWKNYSLVLGAVAVLSLLAWSSYGTHIDDADPIFGGGTEVVDFEPTDRERNEHGMKVLLTLAIPALYGLYQGRRDLGFLPR